MRFETVFSNPKTGKQLTIASELSADEIAEVDKDNRRDLRQLHLNARALRHASREAPPGSVFVAIRALTVH